MFGSFDGDRVSVSITGAANKVFSLEEINNQSPNQLKVYDFDKLEFNEIVLIQIFMQVQNTGLHLLKVCYLN